MKRLANSIRLFLMMALSLVAPGFDLQSAPPARLPNIVLLYGDDIGYGDLGFNGATAVKTPNVDRLAREGLRFTSAYSTSATCTPSRSQVDLSATLAALTGAKPDPVTMADSMNVLPALLGDSKTGRAHLIEYANRLAIREGNWKFIPPGRVNDGLGPWTQVTVPEPGFLFDLAADPGETRDLAAAHPAEIKALRELLARTRDSGRTR